MKSIIVVDDFYRDFASVRRQYLRAKLEPRGGYVGQESTARRSQRLAAAARRIAEAIGVDVTWDWKLGAGSFRTMDYADIVSRRQKVHIHCDPSRWVSNIYLNLAAECHGGTAFYRHRETGLIGFDDLAAARRVTERIGCSLRYLRWLLRMDVHKPRRWEMLDRIAMRENRALIYDGRLFHSHWLDLARMKQVRTARVIQTFFSPPLKLLAI